VHHDWNVIEISKHSANMKFDYIPIGNYWSVISFHVLQINRQTLECVYLVIVNTISISLF